ncbi:MAG TPA: cob(I)yrinic acid a,c-diamide adenosyltransferase [Candidatus Paceibacterota bacterium]|nr:cob(I)yrinic acid a,c-diamide adenosyltransferase [Candidatus Paceibacterota bacterium]
MLYTRKGDDGKTKLFDCDTRLLKSDEVFWALGNLDELNSFVGLLKAKFNDSNIADVSYLEFLNNIQNDLFVIQAFVGGANKKLSIDRINVLEGKIKEIEKEIPPITSFIVPGATEMSALSDVIRCVARRVERSAVDLFEKSPENVDENALIYLNRLSSFFFAFARLLSHRAGVKEGAPKYN